MLLALAAVFFVLPKWFAVSYVSEAITNTIAPAPALDTADYNTRLLVLAHVATSSVWYQAFMLGTTSASTTEPKPLWPTHKPYPNYGALLPFNRIVAYYGNFYSKGMGVLGEYDEETVLTKLQEEVAGWEAADPTTPVVPAIEYIDVTAQGSPGKDGKYRLRMPDGQIDKALAMAKKINGIVILDVQVGLSTVRDELPLLETYLSMPEVHLALDPEFAMQGGTPPGRVIGTMSAEDINYAIGYLSDLVKVHELPPKILVVHRFTEEMVTGYRRINPTPEVQVVMQMDGWGFPAKKINTYHVVVTPEPVQFAGLKLFYKNDLKQTPSRLLTKQEILNLTPSPIFIQYQ
ncbi:hypothetical protein EXS62_02090 [Candidatus Kaiserbacteria bacterium]|nr:hypothetical protein [Candidatus Kaiserbacteria bacterium]